MPFSCCTSQTCDVQGRAERRALCLPAAPCAKARKHTSIVTTEGRNLRRSARGVRGLLRGVLWWRQGFYPPLVPGPISGREPAAWASAAGVHRCTRARPPPPAPRQPTPIGRPLRGRDEYEYNPRLRREYGLNPSIRLFSDARFIRTSANRPKLEMAKAVFTHKAGSGYDDRPEEQYHFPKTYLNQVSRAVGDYIVYYEPRRSDGRQVYFATAKVEKVVADHRRSDHYYALIVEYLEFDQPVPFSVDDFYYESILKKDDGSTNKGAFGRAVRNIPDTEFDLIVRAGFAREINAEPHKAELSKGFEEPQTEFVRPIIEMTVNRPFRDRAFTNAVRLAYGNRCAVTGLKLINGGGRPEVQAAHIKPVANNGPDSVRNGLALSGTFHWMFDRGLISISDDYEILINESKVPDQAKGMLNKEMKLILPNDESMHPNPYYLKYHRENLFRAR